MGISCSMFLGSELMDEYGLCYFVSWRTKAEVPTYIAPDIPRSNREESKTSVASLAHFARAGAGNKTSSIWASLYFMLGNNWTITQKSYPM